MFIVNCRPNSSATSLFSQKNLHPGMSWNLLKIWLNWNGYITISTIFFDRLTHSSRNIFLCIKLEFMTKIWYFMTEKLTQNGALRNREESPVCIDCSWENSFLELKMICIWWTQRNSGTFSYRARQLRWKTSRLKLHVTILRKIAAGWATKKSKSFIHIYENK